ncbi:MAG TPA: hypothetical protein VFW66_07305 [Gemmatimonadales bacterium]|nr:hypothetical protein [Gemmatimonadales bacterium]
MTWLTCRGPENRGGRYARLFVRDKGEGMDENTRRSAPHTSLSSMLAARARADRAGVWL